MNDFRPFVLIERALLEVRLSRRPFKGSWQKSGKRGLQLAKRQKWVKKASQLLR